MQTIQTRAREALRYFEKNARDTWSVSSLAPEWVTALVYEAHDGMMPDDWKYGMTHDALVALCEHDDDDEARDSLEPDVYNGELLSWVASKLTRAAYVDDAIDDGIGGHLFELLQAGQLREQLDVFELVLEALRALECDDDDDSDEEAAQ